MSFDIESVTIDYSKSVTKLSTSHKTKLILITHPNKTEI